MTKIEKYLDSSDPLTRDIVSSLISHKEEDEHLDYKQDFDESNNKSWLELTKDVIAFANTHGGYLIFGISDKDNKITGLSHATATILKDANNIHQKINRHIEPQISSLRSKEFKFDGKSIVGLLIPQSTGLTHIVLKDGEFKYPSGEKKIILKQGTFYVRRSAGNHLGDSRDLDALIDRRIEQFRSSLIDKVARVIKSPANSETFILSEDPSDKSGNKFIIEDSPESISIKGMSFTVAPKDNEEEIAAWSVIYRGNPKNRPPAEELWKWYSLRKKIEISKQHKLALLKFSLWDNVPAFYWIKDLKAKDIKSGLLEAIRGRPASSDSKQMLMIAAFLGEKFYGKCLETFGTYKSKIAQSLKIYPVSGARHEYANIQPIPKQTKGQLKTEKLKELNDIADATIKNNSKQPSLTNSWKAIKIDCFLYAQDGEYK